jgi:hypothetical protein
VIRLPSVVAGCSDDVSLRARRKTAGGMTTMTTMRAAKKSAQADPEYSPNALRKMMNAASTPLSQWITGTHETVRALGKIDRRKATILLEPKMSNARRLKKAARENHGMTPKWLRLVTRMAERIERREALGLTEDQMKVMERLSLRVKSGPRKNRR